MLQVHGGAELPQSRPRRQGPCHEILIGQRASENGAWVLRKCPRMMLGLNP